MSTLIPETTSLPADVVELAARHNNAQYLPELLAGVRRLFPTLQSLRVFTEKDPELRDVEFLVIDVAVPAIDVPDRRQAKDRWYEEFHRIVPPPYNCPYVFALHPVDG